MAKVQVIDKPQRWDLAFSRDLPNPDEQRDMTAQDLDRLMSVKPFCDMDEKTFPKNLPLRGILQNDTRIRHYANGGVVVRQGDYGNSAFLVLSGSVRVVLEGLDPQVVGRRGRRQRSVLRSLARLMTNPRSPEVRDPGTYPQMQAKKPQENQAGRDVVFVQDLVNVIDVFPDAFEKTRNEAIGEGQMFGELAALGRIPRTATVIADGQAQLLEIRWQALRDLRKHDEALKQHVDEQFRKFGLADALRASPLLAHLDEQTVQQVAAAAEFESFGSFDWFGSYKQLRKKDADPLKKEPIIAEQGHYPNGLILIRAGFARLSRKHGHGERTYSYLGKGDIYGMAELARNVEPEVKPDAGPDADRGQQVALGSTLRAVGYVDIVRIPTRTCEQLILPKLPAQLLGTPASPDADRDVALPQASDDGPMVRAGAENIEPSMMEFLVENRFVNGTKTMLIDLDRCTRCDDCVRACASGHTNNPRFIRHGTIFGHHMVANACMHCADPVCMIGCPTGAIHRSEEGGEVVINDQTCIGCTTCAASCPYDNIRMVQVRDQSNHDAVMIDPDQGKPIVKATKCDLCIDHHGGPACERACPHDALKRTDMHDLNTLSKWLNR